MTSEPLTALRSDDRKRWVVTTVAVVLGLGLSTVHWSGLLVAGALAAFPQRTFGRGVAAGVGVGLLVVCLFVARLATVGAVSAVTDMGVVAILPVGIGLGLPAFGALVRGLV